MILYDLKCKQGHLFEGWFKDSATYDAQVKAGEVLCPACGSKKVGKAPMAPRIAKGGQQEQAAKETQAEAKAARKALVALREKVEQSCDYVGPAFAEEARKMHYGESDRRGIYGESSDKDARDLREEGIDVQRIPWLPRENS